MKRPGGVCRLASSIADRLTLSRQLVIGRRGFGDQNARTFGADQASMAVDAGRYRELLRLKNILTTFADYKENDLALEAQKFEDYKSKYLDLHDKVKKEQTADKTSILEDVDFELSLIHRDEINVAYILGLLLGLKNLKPEEAKKRQKEILDMVTTDVQLRSKRELIKTFIEENLPKLKPNENVSSAFEEFWSAHQKAAFDKLCDEEKINPAALAKLLDTYTFANRLPREQEVGGALTFKPKILERKGVLQRVADKIKLFIDTFIEGMGGA